MMTPCCILLHLYSSGSTAGLQAAVTQDSSLFTLRPVSRAPPVAPPAYKAMHVISSSHLKAGAPG